MLEFQLTSDSISTMPIWLSAILAASTLLTLISLTQIGGRRFALSPKLDRLLKGLLASLASLQIFIWQLYFYRDSHDTIPLWCFAIALLVGFALWRFGTANQPATTRSVRTLTIVFAAVSLIELAGFAQATKQFSELVPALDAPEPGVMVNKPHVTGQTDRGTAIRLAARSLSAEEFKLFVHRSQKTLATMTSKAILREPPFVESNCHGWVFTGGEHLVRGDDVQLILNDNGYLRVQHPEPNDIAIYRDNTGFITHTGLVRGNLGDTVMVESKWGIGALYLHVADEQPYAKNIEYYRTHRGSHRIKTVDTSSDTNLAATTIAKQIPPSIR